MILRTRVHAALLLCVVRTTNQPTKRREQHISAFTRIIYFQGIAMSVAFGDCAPLVGHNAFLRWESVRKVSEAERVVRLRERVIVKWQKYAGGLAQASSAGRTCAVCRWRMHTQFDMC